MTSATEAKRWLGDFDSLAARLETSSLGEIQALCALGRAKLDAVEARALAAEVPADGDTRRASRVAGRGGKRSKASARKVADRAKAVAANKGLADDLDSGKLSSEQVDLIAGAMDTDESAATDQDLIDAVSEASVDQGRKIVSDWKSKNSDKDKVESEHQRMRRLRSVRRYFNKMKGLDTIIFEGDSVSLDEV